MTSHEVIMMKDGKGVSQSNPWVYDMNSYSSVKVKAQVPEDMEGISSVGDDTEDDASDASDDSQLESSSDFQPRPKKHKRPGQWILANFKKKGCIKYVQDPNRSYKTCYCGRNQRGHTSLPRTSCSAEWLPNSLQPGEHPQRIAHSKSVQDFQLRQVPDDEEEEEASNKADNLVEFPTDAFGEIHFKESVDSLSRAKFVRLSDKTEMRLIIDLLTKYWKLSKPRLVISLTGGGRSFNLSERDKETFSRGIVKAAWTTDAWIITAGFNAGVPQIIGKAVQLSHTQDWIMANKNAKKGQERNKLKCIGLAPWGYVDGSHQLLTRHGQGSYPAHYKVNSIKCKGLPMPLNPDHTHFILIDNGLKGEQSYGGEIIMRSMIEEAIAAPQEENGLGLSVVMVVLEGGIDTILNVKNAVMRGIPTVVCDGSGRAADIIAFAYSQSEGESESRTLNDTNTEILRGKLQNAFNVDTRSESMNQLIEDVIICIKDKKLITVFQMVDTIENAGLDHAILIGLLKAQAATASNELELALSWNRVDVAERKIFVDDQDWPPGSLDSFLMQSLINNQVDFLRLFLEKGAIMKDVLTVCQLRRLYNSVNNQHSLRLYVALVNNTKPKRPIFLQHVGRLISSLMGVHRNKLYTQDKPFTCDRKESVGLIALTSALAGSFLTHQAQEEYLKSQTDWSVTTGSPLKLSISELANPGLHFKYPFKELFLSAVLMCRMEMAEFFWERIEDSVCSGIVASTILKGMAAMSKDPDDMLETEKNARTFELLAVDVMDKCYKADDILAERLIGSPKKHWGGKSVLAMAAEAGNKTFIAHSCPQSVVKKIWLGGMRAGPWKVCLAVLCPILIFQIKFPGLPSPHRSLHKLWTFYNSPITKFGTFVVSYAAFLLLYSYVMLDTFSERPSVAEIVLFGWISTMIVEEIRQAVIPGEHETVKQRFYDWASNEWNIIDLITTIVAVLAFVLHWFPEAFRWSQGFYAINCCLYYSRLLRLFSVNEKLGPKMVMIKKMLGEMVTFLFIFLVFLLGYGIASNILLYPHQEFSIDSIKNSIYMPYFQVYGELFLNTINREGDQNACDASQHNCPKQHVLLPIMLGAYLLLGNVLLLNLLIAIFSSIFDDVEKNSLEVWKFEQYFLTVEFEDRPALPPPFIILEHTLQILCWACCKKKDNKVVYLTKKMKRILRTFEKDCAANYRREKIEKKSTEIPERLSLIEKKLKDLDRQAKQNKDDLQKELQHVQQLREDEDEALRLDTMTTLPHMEESAAPNSPNRKPIDFPTALLMVEQERQTSYQPTPYPTKSQEEVQQRQEQLLYLLNDEMMQTSASCFRPGSDERGHYTRNPKYIRRRAAWKIEVRSDEEPGADFTKR